MATKTEPDIEGIEHLDFRPGCRMIEAPAYKGKEVCGKPATWMAFLPCCGHQSFACDGHQRHELGERRMCIPCGATTPVATWKWSRL